jgi:alkanesulfonate monooxygenase SsuD/methylene tetrahydromethanopterin reductase-like flavin-dependent oxidoreductase (luciferase family)
MSTDTEELQGLAGPLSSPNKLRLGTFGSNSERANAMTTIPGALKAEWGETLWAAQTVDRLGFEAIVPLCRWKGIGGVTNFNGRGFDVITWAAGIAQATTYPMVFSTVNVNFINPIVAAKQLSTIDHISGGRAALNVVAGWFRPEMDMFGIQLPEHDVRYELADEFVDILKLLWTNGEFEEVTFIGDHFQVIDGYSEPTPLRRPHPPIMNAGTSPRSQEFTASRADIAFIFTNADDVEGARAQVKNLKDKAAANGRELQVWTYAYIVSRDTQAEAQEYLRWYSEEYGDPVAAEQTMRVAGMESNVLGDAAWGFYRQRFIAGSGGLEMLGTPDQIVERLKFVSEVGCDGTLLSWPDWRTDIPYFEKEILPRMEQAGLREPFARAAS